MVRISFTSLGVAAKAHELIATAAATLKDNKFLIAFIIYILLYVKLVF